MINKKCIKCGETKDVSEFSKNNSRIDNLNPYCKLCIKKKYDLKKLNLIWCEKEKERKLKYYFKNKTNEEYKNRQKLHVQKYRDKNRKSINKNNRNKYHKDIKFKEKKTIYRKKYRENNKNKINKYNRYYQHKRKKEDVIFNIKRSLRIRLCKFLKSRNWKKTNTTMELVGCTPDELRKHLEEQFKKDMSWDNRSDWHIDHIVPLCSAKSEEDLYELCHYTNLQPLWAKDNLIKGGRY